MEKFRSVIQKIPLGAISLIFPFFTYFVAGTTGMLVLPVILCIIFVLPWGVLFAILDIIIRKKKLIPIISLAISLWPIIGFTFMMISIAFEAVSSIINAV
jgi:hypothetical protein